MAIRIIISDKNCAGSECSLCIYYCPHEVLGISERQSRIGGNLPEVISLENCTVCRLCEFHCPEMAISVYKEEE
jgi:2-oxoglutarate ferredoxin oxidoreductase subunit delta